MEMTTELSGNLFCFPEQEKSSEADNTLIFEEIRRELEEYYLEKVTTLILQTVFSKL